ncbi:putative metalloprotease [Paracoccus alcaliphilus]|uniref:Putative metalloprotease n=1 Tax=Paracoccus alcaliphilus TaxID=34002 RepID=A0A1H8E237_9RHOB|nr:M48 family metallopeptidase [Paracoccus alcaliphilus]WCR16809.1 M48 family metallopeptidase [Paracoccus alcaliphilus]SEN13661.1 putative metalloprotease [Paracoccus alcaliphilus]
MLKLTPILLLIAYMAVMWFFSAWRLKQDLKQKSSPLNHPRLSPMLKRLGEAMDLPPIRAQIYEVEPVNGLAAPDGRIFLTRGFIRKLDACEVTPEELASVIAHELGHVSLGHSRRRMIDFAGQNAIRMALAGVLGRIIPGIGPWIATLIANAVAARLSRQDEFEADRFASALMMRAGLGTAPQKSLFRKLDKMAGGRSTAPAWFLSHPPVERRIAAIEQHEARWQKG